jgi:hypothetical protein
VTNVSLYSWAKRRGVRQKVREAAELALARNLPDTQRLLLGSRLANFIKSFDTIEEGAQDDVWRAIEEAFHLGKHAAVIKVVTEKEIGKANAKLARDAAAQAKKRKGPGPVERAVRAEMDADPTITGSEKYAFIIKPKIDKTMGKSVPEPTIWRYMKKRQRENKQEQP